MPLAAQERRPRDHAGRRGEPPCSPTWTRATFLGFTAARSPAPPGLVVCVLGLGFGLVSYPAAQEYAGAPVDARGLRADLRDLQDLPGEQGKFLLVLWVFIGVAVAVYFGKLATTIDPATGAEVHGFPLIRVAIILVFSLIGMAGSYGGGLVRHPDQHLRQLAHRLRQPARQGLSRATTIPLKAGMSIGMLLISVELLLMLVHPAVHSRRVCRAPASSASRSASRSARRRSGSPAASSPRSPTSAPT